MNLSAYSNRIETVFSLLGNDENALTFALGYTFQQCPELLQKTLLEIGFGGLPKSFITLAKINLQRADKKTNGITDIEIVIHNKLHIIIEAKIGLEIPSISQCKKYLPRFNGDEEKKALIVLTESLNKNIISTYIHEEIEFKDKLKGLSWEWFSSIAIKLLNDKLISNHSRFWIQQLDLFLTRSYQMRSFNAEVWIVSANQEPLWEGGISFYDTHINNKIYYHTNFSKQRPLYIAFRCNGKVEAIQKVIGCEYNKTPIEYIPNLDKVDATWPNELHTIWHLGDPVKLPKAIPTDDKHMRARRIYCDFDILLSCDSISHAEKLMKERKNTD